MPPGKSPLRRPRHPRHPRGARHSGAGPQSTGRTGRRTARDPAGTHGWWLSQADHRPGLPTGSWQAPRSVPQACALRMVHDALPSAVSVSCISPLPSVRVRQASGTGVPDYGGQRTWRRSVNLRKLRTVQTVLGRELRMCRVLLNERPIWQAVCGGSPAGAASRSPARASRSGMTHAAAPALTCTYPRRAPVQQPDPRNRQPSPGAKPCHTSSGA